MDMASFARESSWEMIVWETRTLAPGWLEPPFVLLSTSADLFMRTRLPAFKSETGKKKMKDMRTNDITPWFPLSRHPSPSPTRHTPRRSCTPLGHKRLFPRHVTPCARAKQIFLKKKWSKWDAFAWILAISISQIALAALLVTLSCFFFTETINMATGFLLLCNVDSRKGTGGKGFPPCILAACWQASVSS